MQTQTTGEDRIWRAIGQLEGGMEASFIAIRRELNQMRRDMRETKAKAGWPLWVHLTAMAAISVLSILGIVKPEMAKAVALKLLFKLATG